MRYDQVRVCPFIACLLMSAPVFADETLTIADVTEAACASLLPDAKLALGQLAPELTEETSYSFIAEAIYRHCAALGIVPFDEPEQNEQTRSHSAGGETPAQRSDRLTREARYYFETAMQIDPDASNDLLRRLLGSGPKPKD
ncbi:hypothetical protein J7394_19995 [Ruegeria sp. R13_0]|uniref:hypothetical protein n=1 Tax=Ruegeria sp. R13_0 TaxID=2821099 RepID=UPI001ADACC0C|nr:hypothetical protein [Ruegeria sp. R13_0]MBO9436506.1 hypothetical protein [Ruegeria sp. R13_0]